MGALDLIIARGFGDRVREVGSAYREGMQERQAFEAKKVDDAQRASINDFELTAAQQRQATQLQDRARLQSIPQQMAEIDALLQADPNNADARRRAVELATEMGILTGGRVDAGGLLAAPQSNAPKIGQLNPGDYTPESFARYAQTGDLNVLRRYERAREPAAPPDPPKPPSGYQWKDPSNPRAGVTPLQGGPQDPNAVRPPSAEERKAVVQAQQKLPRVKALDRRIERLEKALQGVRGGLVDTGPLDQFAVAGLEKGQEVASAVAQIMPELQALTRVPGIGSQSDLEARLAALALPSLGQYPDVNDRSLAELKAFVADLKAAYESVAGGESQSGGPPPALSRDPEARRSPVAGAVFQMHGATVEILPQGQ